MAAQAGGDIRAGIGTRLRAAREKRGLTILQAAERMHVDARTLESLEAEDFAALGAPVYARGHLRHYAELVGESAAELQGLYADSTKSAPAQPDLTRIARMEPVGDPGRLVGPAVVGLVAVALIGTVWWLLSLSGEKVQPATVRSSAPSNSTGQATGSAAGGTGQPNPPEAADADVQSNAVGALPDSAPESTAQREPKSRAAAGAKGGSPASTAATAAAASSTSGAKGSASSVRTAAANTAAAASGATGPASGVKNAAANTAAAASGVKAPASSVKNAAANTAAAASGAKAPASSVKNAAANTAAAASGAKAPASSVKNAVANTVAGTSGAKAPASSVRTAAANRAAQASGAKTANAAASTASVATTVPAAAAAATTTAVAAVAPRPGPRGKDGELTLKFSSDSWAEVYDASGQRLFYDVGAASSAHTMKGPAPLRVILGNASGVAIEFNGRPALIPAAVQPDGSARFVINARGRTVPASPASDGD